jgi:hypothetical protein
MIQALRDLIDLYTFYYETLERFLDGLLDLLCVCICQGRSVLFLQLCLSHYTNRERYTCAYRNIVLATVPGEQREQVERNTVGTRSIYFCEALPDNDTSSVV